MKNIRCSRVVTAFTVRHKTNNAMFHSDKIHYNDDKEREPNLFCRLKLKMRNYIAFRISHSN